MIQSASAMSVVGVFVTWLSVLQFGTQNIHAQPIDAAGTKENLKWAIARLESSSADEWSKAEAVLMRSMQNAAERERAIRGLAILHIRRGNTQAIIKFCGQIDSIFPTRSEESNLQMLRIQLWHDLALENEAKANEHFSQLLALADSSKISKPSRIASVAMLGSIVGMLDAESAKSPIPNSQLSPVVTKFSQASQSELARVFSSNHDRAKVEATAISQWLELHATEPIDQLQSIADREIQAVETKRSLLTQSLVEAKKEVHDIDLAVRQLKSDKRNGEKAISMCEAQWASHPEIHNPIAPNRMAIRATVPRTQEVENGTREERQYKTVTKKDGRTEKEYTGTKTVKTYKTVRLSEFQIDNATDAIYLPLLKQFQSLMLAREELINSKRMLEARMKELTVEIPTTERAFNTTNKTLRLQSQEVEDLQRQENIIRQASMARLSGNPVVAFRPPSFRIFDYSSEKNVLLPW